MTNVIVAGANGFIGRNLIDNLIGRGYHVTALGNTFSDEIKCKAECICVAEKNVDELAHILCEKKYVCFYDLAWMGTSGDARTDYNVQLDNVRITCDYVRLAAELKCLRFIYASSINEMETYEYLQKDRINPSGGYIYGTGKLAAHFMGEVVAKMNGVEFIPVIITNIYGIGEKSQRLIYTSIRKLLKGEHCSFTEGNQTYDFIYISDAINSIVEVGEKGEGFTRYYIGSGQPRPLREFLTKMRDIVAPNAELGLGDIPFNGESINYDQFQLKKIERDTGYKNKVDFEEGIRMTANYIRMEEEL